MKQFLFGLIFSMAAFCENAYSSCISGNENIAVAYSTPDKNFSIHGNGTVVDLKNGLMWKRCSQGQMWNGSGCIGDASLLDWSSSLIEANADEFLGYHDWRLPNVKELQSILENRCWAPSVNGRLFPDAPTSGQFRYWTSSPYFRYETLAWFVSFSHGDVDLDYKESLLRVRLVRTTP